MLPDTYAEIDLSQLIKNFKGIRSNIKKTTKSIKHVCSIVKANAYGHGISEISKILAESGTDYFGTANYRESIFLKTHLKKINHGSIPILCLGVLPQERESIQEIIGNGIEVGISSFGQAEMLNNVATSVNTSVNVHIKIDTGMNRIGLDIIEAYDSILKIKNFSHLKIKGIYSHLATSEIPDDNFTAVQINKFIEIVREVEQQTGEIKFKHIQNTGGIINNPSLKFFNMIRPGIILYGYSPTEDLQLPDRIQPVMTFKTKVKFIKKVKQGDTISYGRSYKVKHTSTIASLPVGYGDGYPRLLSNKGQVFIRKKLFPVVGNVCMDWIMIDVTGSKVRLEDTVEIFGKNYPVHKISKKLGTIPYEILCMIAPRVERVYIN